MRLWAISDLHVGVRANRAFLKHLPTHPTDWLIVAGDVGETLEHLDWTFSTLCPRFKQLIWVPGNHELWTPREAVDTDPRGTARYKAMVDLCRGHGVLTPEDPYPVWQGEGGKHTLCPLFVLYDYSFCPSDVPADGAVAWAAEAGLRCKDERLLHPVPYASREAWCAARVNITCERLDALDPDMPTVLINHYPLHERHAVLPRVPRFKIWCGTRATEDWPERYHAKVVVYGHLHIPTTRLEHGVRYEEVSLGYPRQWKGRVTPQRLLRQILPAPHPLQSGFFHSGR